ncbi:DUF6923 family protein [Saccharopolyspora griseoalba]|uniref:DUF6923 family protein n=1 Tax=Saccharopolyspora griseoalba TaxID=1431848 RepID=A0ABW2LC32_9PSEU
MGAGTTRAALTAALLGGLLVAAPPAASPGPACQALQVRGHGSASVLHRIDLSSGDDSRIGPLPEYVNALGHSRRHGVAYGMAAGFVDGAHVLEVRADGSTRDRGPVRGPRGNPFELPSAGAIAGNRWYVVEDEVLYAVDVERMRVLSAVELEPVDLGDLDVDPVDGTLLSVSDSGALVRIDRGSGRVEPVADLAGLPDDHYGSVVIGRSREIYASGYAGGLYRAERDGSVRRLGELEFATSSDMAGCWTAPQPPPEPSPPPTPTPPPTPSPPPTSTKPPEPTSSPAPPETSTPTPTTETPTPTTETPEPPRPPRPSASPKPTPSARPTRTQSPEPAPAPPTTDTEAAPGPSETTTPSSEDEDEGAAAETGHSTEDKRRWAVAMLAVILGGGLAVRRLR